MKAGSILTRVTFWTAVLLLAAGAALAVAAFYGRLLFIFDQVGQISIHHVLSITGAAFIVLYTPSYYTAKRRFPKAYLPLLTVHVLGNAAAFVLISIHFGEHLSEFAGVRLHPGTGVPLYTALLVLVITGIILRFVKPGKLTRRLRFWHLSFAVSFALIVLFHALYGFGLFE